MDYCDCEFCNSVQPSGAAWRAPTADAVDLPRPRPIRPVAATGPASYFPAAFQPATSFPLMALGASRDAAAAAASLLFPLASAADGRPLNYSLGVPTGIATAGVATLPTTSNLNAATTVNNNDNNNKNNSDDNKTANEKTQFKTWYNEDVASEARSFRDFLKLTACEFKRSIEPTFDATAEKSRHPASKTTQRNVTKRQKAAALKAPAVTVAPPDSSLYSTPSLSGLYGGSDRFSPSSVSCASVDSGFAESVYPPSSPESTAPPTSFAALQTPAPLKRPHSNTNINNDVDNNKAKTSEEKENLTFEPCEKKLSFEGDENNNDDDHKTMATESNSEECEECPAPKVRRISDLFFNSSTSNFVNSLLKRSRENNESQCNVEASLSQHIEAAKLGTSEKSEQKASITVPLACCESVAATIKTAPRKSNAPYAKTVAELYLQPEMQPIVCLSLSDEIDRFSVASTSSLSSSPVSELGSQKSSSLTASASSSDNTEAMDDEDAECGCHWMGCTSRFCTDNQLYDHVLESHIESLRPNQKEQNAARPASTRQKASAGGRKAETLLVCKWDNCRMCLKRGDHQKQFEWLIEHYTTRHASRAQPFACLFGDCNLRFRTRRTLNDHLLSAHDSERPNGKRNSNIHSNGVGDSTSQCYRFIQRIHMPLRVDLLGSRTMYLLRQNLKTEQNQLSHKNGEFVDVKTAPAQISRSAPRKIRTPQVVKVEKYAAADDEFSLNVGTAHLSIKERPNLLAQPKMARSEVAQLLEEFSRGANQQRIATFA